MVTPSLGMRLPTHLPCSLNDKVHCRLDFQFVSKSRRHTFEPCDEQDDYERFVTYILQLLLAVMNAENSILVTSTVELVYMVIKLILF